MNALIHLSQGFFEEAAPAFWTQKHTLLVTPVITKPNAVDWQFEQPVDEFYLMLRDTVHQLLGKVGVSCGIHQGTIKSTQRPRTLEKTKTESCHQEMILVLGNKVQCIGLPFRCEVSIQIRENEAVE